LTRPHPTSTLFPYTTLFRSAWSAKVIAMEIAPLPELLAGCRVQARGSVGAEMDVDAALFNHRGWRSVTVERMAKRWLLDLEEFEDRKSTRLNSSHSQISYAV